MTLQATWTHSRPAGSSTEHRRHEEHSPSFSWSAGCHYVAVYRRGCWRHQAPHRCRLVRSAESIRTVRLRVGPARRRKQLSIQYLGQNAGLRGLSSKVQSSAMWPVSGEGTCLAVSKYAGFYVWLILRRSGTAQSAFTATTQRAGQTGVQIPTTARYFYLIHNVETVSGAHPASCSKGSVFFPAR